MTARGEPTSKAGNPRRALESFTRLAALVLFWATGCAALQTTSPQDEAAAASKQAPPAAVGQWDGPDRPPLRQPGHCPGKCVVTLGGGLALAFEYLRREQEHPTVDSGLSEFLPERIDLMAPAEQYPCSLGPRVGVGERVDQTRRRGRPQELSECPLAE